MNIGFPVGMGPEARCDRCNNRIPELVIDDPPRPLRSYCQDCAGEIFSEEKNSKMLACAFVALFLKVRTSITLEIPELQLPDFGKR
jgi:hypothetical protein